MPCAQLMTRCGPSPASSGAAITPLTAIGSPSRPTDRYSTVQSRMSLTGLRISSERMYVAGFAVDKRDAGGT